MNIFVHLMFATTVRRRIKKSLGVSLSYFGFLYGNILPDISRKYGYHPHYLKDSLNHVIISKDRLIDSNNPGYSSYRFAKELGAINHYLSDFFCMPHTERFQGTRLNHGIYELAMMIRYKKGHKAFRHMLKEQSSTLKPSDLKSFIEENSITYSQNKGSDILDISYALFAGTKLSESMILYSAAVPPKLLHKVCLLES